MQGEIFKFWTWPRERWIAITGALIGLFFALWVGLHDDEGVYRSFVKGVGAAFATMVVLGFAQQFWRGKKLQNATGPGGMGGGFEEATEGAVEELNKRVDLQMQTVNERLGALEKHLFESDGESTGE